jgi:iron(III) transport system ATP-binding protein
MKALSLQHLTRSFGPITALEDFSLEVKQGELVTILGPSGCGKSTLLSCIAGIEQPDSGRVIVGGTVFCDVHEGIYLPPEQRNIGFVFQNYALWPHMSVEKNIAYPLRVRKKSHGFIDSETRRIIEMIKLNGKELMMPWQLSGGEQQRVALGRALIMQPDLLLLDEPLSNLDAGLREQMQEQIRALQQSLNLTTIHVTHDQSEALAISDRVVLMNSGSIMQEGRPRELYEHPTSLFTARFIGTNNFIEGVIRSEGGFLQFSCDPLHLRVSDQEMIEGPATCMIRPEDIHIDVAPLRPSAVQAVVEQRLFRGAHYQYVLKVGSITLKAQAHTSEYYPTGRMVSLNIVRSRFLPG